MFFALISRMGSLPARVRPLLPPVMPGATYSIHYFPRFVNKNAGIFRCGEQFGPKFCFCGGYRTGMRRRGLSHPGFLR